MSERPIESPSPNEVGGPVAPPPPLRPPPPPPPMAPPFSHPTSASPPAPHLSTDAPVLAHSVSKTFGSIVAVSDVSFSLSAGVTALLGPNGAGKSTLMRVLCGLSPPTHGQVLIAGADPRKDAAARRSIGLVPQQDGIFSRETIRQFLHLVATLSAVDDVPAAIDLVAARLELDEMLDRPIGMLSKGYKQRVKIASALVHDPPIVVMDEPLNGLDPRQRRAMFRLFEELSDEGKTVIVSSHVLEEVELFASEILIIARGRLAASGDFRQLRRQMEDVPLRYRVVTSETLRVATALLGGGAVNSISVSDDTIELTTHDAPEFRRQLISLSAQHSAIVREIEPLDEDLDSVFRRLAY